MFVLMTQAPLQVPMGRWVENRITKCVSTEVIMLESVVLRKEIVCTQP